VPRSSRRVHLHQLDEGFDVPASDLSRKFFHIWLDCCYAWSCDAPA
jgi:hypothetical protein